jgi:hypothetical protein
MHFIFSLCLFIVYHACYSFQARLPRQALNRNTPEIHLQDATSLLQIIKGRPAVNYGPDYENLEKTFSQHFDVKKLEDLNGEEFLRHALNLRSVVNEEDAKVKLKYRKAICDYVLDAKGNGKEGTELHTTLRSRLFKMMRAQNDKKYKKKRMERDPVAWKERNSKYVREFKEKERVNGAFVEETLFEQKMKALGIPPNASAKEVEEASRGVVFKSPQHTTTQLRKYLADRYNLKDVENAIATRSYMLSLDTHRREYRLNASRRKLKSRKDRGEHSQAASSNQAEKIPTLSTITRHKGEDDLGNHFDPTEWWSELYDT